MSDTPEGRAERDAALADVARLREALTGPLGDVLLERERQINKEGWSIQHDDTHIRGEMASAAACYAVPSRHRLEAFKAFWPSSWSELWWKPAGPHSDLSARRRDLVKAAALIVAEMERIDRLLARAEGRADE